MQSTAEFERLFIPNQRHGSDQGHQREDQRRRRARAEGIAPSKRRHQHAQLGNPRPALPTAGAHSATATLTPPLRRSGRQHGAALCRILWQTASSHTLRREQGRSGSEEQCAPRRPSRHPPTNPSLCRSVRPNPVGKGGATRGVSGGVAGSRRLPARATVRPALPLDASTQTRLPLLP